MLQTFVETNENYDAFLRPAIHDSIRAVLGYYGLLSATNIYYNGKNEIAKLIGNNATDGPSADRYTDGIFRNKIFIVPEVTRSEFWSNRRAMTERPVFAASENLPLIVCPGFENKVIRVTVVSMHNSYAEAEKFQISINRKRENQVVDFNFNPINHMVFNESLLEFIEICHGMLQRGKPDTPDFFEWFMANTKVPFHFVSNVAGNQQQLVVPLKQMNVGIQFTEAFIAKSRASGTYGRFEVEFSYSFYLNDFIGWDVEYPLNIYQEEIPEQFITAPQPQHQQDLLVRAAPEVEDGRALNPPVDQQQTPFYLKQPKHDPWAHPGQFWIQPVVQARLVVDDVPEQVMLNIFDIPDFQWSQSVKNYLLRRHEVAFVHHDTPFLLQIWEGDTQVDPTLLRMDETGTVTMYKQPDMRKTYRVVVTLDYAIRDYSENFWNDLSMNLDQWPLVTSIFYWFDFNEIPRPWIENIYLIKKGIDKGWGKWEKPFNIYEMNLDFIAHNLR